MLPSVHPTWVPEFFGDTIIVNGKAGRNVEVEPRTYRLRLLERLQRALLRADLAPDPQRGNRKPTMWQIGADGGFLPVTVPLDRLLLAPGERADVLVDFSGFAGATLVLRNNAKAPYPSGESPDPRTVGQVMQFRVGRAVSSPETSVVPAAPGAVPRLVPTPGAPIRDVKMSEILDAATGVPTKLELEDKGWMDRPATLTPRLHTTEVWRLVNTTADTHPMHLHLVQFQVVSRQRFNVRRYDENGNRLEPTLIGLPRWPAPNEMG